MYSRINSSSILSDILFSVSVTSWSWPGNGDHFRLWQEWSLISIAGLLTLKRPGGGGGLNNNPPLDFFCDHSAARNFLPAALADFLLSSLTHLMTPFSRKSGIPLRRCTTFYTSSSDQKWLKNVILCTKSMQMEFSHLIHKDMIIFTFFGWNQVILA